MTSQDTPPAGGPGGSPPSVEELAGEFAHFKVHELLGYGGMGAVYRAEQESMGRMVALKVLLAPGGIAKDLGERFGREARAMAKLSHANIVQVFGLGETTSGRPYFVMEYVEGGTLRELVKQGPVEPGRAMEIVGEVCDALQYAHAKGIVHRDIKPGNILLGAGGRVKVSDFGLAKILGHEETQMKLTRTQGAMGTHGYIAPEQMESGSVIDGRADIYSVGVTLYEMLTGELPRGAFRPPSALVAGLDRRVDDIVVRAMLAEPSQRYQNISEIRSSLEFVRDDESGELPLPEAGSGGASDAWQPPGRIASTPGSASVKRKHGAKGWLMAGAAVVGLGVAAFLLIPSRFGGEQAEEPDDREAMSESREFEDAARALDEGTVVAGMSEPDAELKVEPATGNGVEPVIRPSLSRPEVPHVFPLERPGPGGRLVFWPRPGHAVGDPAGTVVDVPEHLEDVIAIEVDHGWDKVPKPSHAVALRADGTVVAWGENAFGQAEVPEGLGDVVAIDAGRDHNLALRADGTVVAWGRSEHRQCQVPEGLEKVVEVAAGAQHSLALKADGTVAAWGASGAGQSDVPEGLADVVGITSGPFCSLALRSDGTVVAWGMSSWGQAKVPAGLRDVVAVHATENRFFALRGDGSLLVWGEDTPAEGFEIGGPVVEIRDTRAAPVGQLFRQADGSWVCLRNRGKAFKELELPIDGLTEVTVTTEGFFGITPSKPGGDGLAQATDTTTAEVTAAGSADMSVPEPSPGEPLPELVAAFAKLKPGKLEAWPLDESASQDTAGTIADFPPNLGEIVAFEVKRYWMTDQNRVSAPHALALRADGTVVAWGENSFGQCDIPEGLANVVAISAGGRHSLALRVDGRVVTWGSNRDGMIRVPDTLEPVIAIAASVAHSLVVQNDGTVVAWGEDWGGQLEVPGDLKDVVAVAGAEMRSLALTRTGELVAWGTNNQWAGAMPYNLFEVTSIGAMVRNELALQRDGVLVGWGESFPGELLRVPGVSRLGAVRELESITFVMDGDQWHFLDVAGGTFEPIPIKRAAGCTMMVLVDGFVMVIRPATELDGQLAALEAGFREKYRQAVLPGYVEGVAALDEKYSGALERGRLAAVEAGDLKLAILYRDELSRLEAKGPLPEAPPASADEGFRTLVEAYLEKLGALQAVRETQAAPLLRAYEESLLKLENAQKEESEAVRVRAVREGLGSETFWEGM